MKLRKAWDLFSFTEVAGKGREAFHREREYSESKLRLIGLENSSWRKDSPVGEDRKQRQENHRSEDEYHPTRIVHSISNRNPDQRRVRGLLSAGSKNDRRQSIFGRVGVSADRVKLRAVAEIDWVSGLSLYSSLQCRPELEGSKSIRPAQLTRVGRTTAAFLSHFL
jgi:hypothetical protein